MTTSFSFGRKTGPRPAAGVEKPTKLASLRRAETGQVGAGRGTPADLTEGSVFAFVESFSGLTAAGIEK
jgi:hypothetical protein